MRRREKRGEEREKKREGKRQEKKKLKGKRRDTTDECEWKTQVLNIKQISKTKGREKRQTKRPYVITKHYYTTLITNEKKAPLKHIFRLTVSQAMREPGW